MVMRTVYAQRCSYNSQECVSRISAGENLRKPIVELLNYIDVSHMYGIMHNMYRFVSFDIPREDFNFKSLSPNLLALYDDCFENV